MQPNPSGDGAADGTESQEQVPSWSSTPTIRIITGLIEDSGYDFLALLIVPCKDFRKLPMEILTRALEIPRRTIAVQGAVILCRPESCRPTQIQMPENCMPKSYDSKL
ncbi:hypothetical protein MPTK1_8g00890 [Marchantia polymorpha subsp. ruderalis]|uniref:Uncharacterized protein n=1 Tax=Marchantia polymorpha TaxID=3197 RepID=A0A2R6WRI5_MARPO|nr:hypothetical protein MARPO_0064s0108 [Marchantia polymorpha]BBN18239.1 hypothetical protein Mp_8g00890 [Marchantia polymorpha subsp. ruderalis]|eukprot:PTQ36434.1 hypothetical protein MARPO_0064s0108 [Marchantia polymorpha]